MILRRVLAWAAAAAFLVAFVVLVTSRIVVPMSPTGQEVVAGPLTAFDLSFYLLSGLAFVGAFGVALSKNVLHSAIGLLIALLGGGALYVLLSADFVAVAQLLVYVGGVLVLVLFAVMLTARIEEVNISNKSFGVFGGLALFFATAPVLSFVAVKTPWPLRQSPELVASTEAIGNEFLGRYLLPFEVASLVLLATLIGAVVIARKETRPE
ncbi:NADH-quinone oxidoreductase subunit J family protein [Anaeromyxobacter paludicola]|uniref:NADH-quinone oxidoreductase subunit J n=1 Tax=Anaeromyxobacter paludicola TaxID=2918171 RepID=A0ABM7X5B8_9BACT|nr:NADH-quinone oxidoreductase subunit J [Anaeromyxobacter paludicola]BDG07019.1 NADH:ubiquinone oxidoreductase subunit J [Anaeromyxobacter paludicola]